MNFRFVFRVVILTFACLSGTGVLTPAVRAEGQWGFGTEVGFVSGTVDDTVFAIGANLDYYPDPNFSFGAMLQLAPIGDLTQIGIAGAARYHFHFNNGINLVPFVGFGLIHADLNKGSGPTAIDRNDTSWYLPIGLSLEYQVARNLALTSTLVVNLYDLNLSPSIPEHDHTSVALLFGFRWGP